MRGLKLKLRADAKLALEAVASRAAGARERALSEAGERLRARSVAIAPRRTGALAASARVETGGGSARVAYHAPYAAYQHENLHLRHPGGGRAKYLSSVAEDARSVELMERAWADALREVLR